MLNIAAALEQIKGRVTEILPEELIHELCREVGHR